MATISYVGLPVDETTVALLSHVRAKKIILAAASAHSIDHLSCSAKSLTTLVGAEKLETRQRPGKLQAAGSKTR